MTPHESAMLRDHVAERHDQQPEPLCPVCAEYSRDLLAQIETAADWARSVPGSSEAVH